MRGKYIHIDEDCQIGENVTIEDFVSIYSGTVLKDNCIIRSGARIGVSAFSFQVADGATQKRSNLGTVVIGEGAEIGYNTVIQRGVERNTEIGAGCHINNLCNIGHDVIMGERVTFGISASVSGHSTLGDDVYVAPGVTIMNRVKIHDRANIGIGSLVIHDVDEGVSVTGRPAQNLAEFKEERAALKNLLGLDHKERVISTKKRRWSKTLSRKISAIRQKYLTW